jgi:sugar phosphate isomerase/epimerase
MTTPSNAPTPAALPPVSVQLYSLRDEAAVDFAPVLRRLGATGFVGVELAGFHNLSPAEFAAVATDSGLVVSSGHFGDATPSALHATLDSFQEVGCDTAILAFLPPERFADLDAVKASADVLNAAYAIATARGLKLGYHNHWWEFQTQIDGRPAWAHLWERLEPGVVAELDTYWATVGGADPKAVIADLGPRLAFLHVKDGPADDPKSPMVAVGSGSMDIAGILDAAPAARWHVVELDRCATDMADAIDESYTFLVANGLSRGRR